MTPGEAQPGRRRARADPRRPAARPPPAGVRPAGRAGRRAGARRDQPDLRDAQCSSGRTCQLVQAAVGGFDDVDAARFGEQPADRRAAGPEPVGSRPGPRPAGSTAGPQRPSAPARSGRRQAALGASTPADRVKLTRSSTARTATPIAKSASPSGARRQRADDTQPERPPVEPARTATHPPSQHDKPHSPAPAGPARTACRRLSFPKVASGLCGAAPPRARAPKILPQACWRFAVRVGKVACAPAWRDRLARVSVERVVLGLASQPPP